ncbi:MAG: hypothetical protein ABR597_14385 [Bacteroidales bacterium]
MKKSLFFVFACIILIACDTTIEEPLSDDMILLKSKSLSVENCENVRFQGVFGFGGLAFDFSEMTNLFEALKYAGAFNEHPKYGIPIAGFEGCIVYGGGALPITTTIAGVTGELGSIVTHMYYANEKENSAVFYHLFHLFISDDGAFVTWDHAVQSPMHPKKYTARINNKLEVLAGTGIFENASGKLINNGIITFGANELPLEIHANVHGRICGDGIGK